MRTGHAAPTQSQSDGVGGWVSGWVGGGGAERVENQLPPSGTLSLGTHHAGNAHPTSSTRAHCTPATHASNIQHRRAHSCTRVGIPPTANRTAGSTQSPREQTRGPHEHAGSAFLEWWCRQAPAARTDAGAQHTQPRHREHHATGKGQRGVHHVFAQHCEPV